jgi:hypothetical protein
MPHSAIHVLQVQHGDQQIAIPTVGLRATNCSGNSSSKALRPSCFQLFLDKPVTGTRVHCPQSCCSWRQQKRKAYYEHWNFWVPRVQTLGVTTTSTTDSWMPSNSYTEPSALRHVNLHARSHTAQHIYQPPHTKKEWRAIHRKIATRDDTVVLPSGRDANFSFTIRAEVKAPVWAAYIHCHKRVLPEKDEFMSTSEIPMCLVCSTQRTDLCSPAFLWRNLVRKIAHNTTANRANYCITKSGHESLKYEMWHLLDKGLDRQHLHATCIHTHILCLLAP